MAKRQRGEDDASNKRDSRRRTPEFRGSFVHLARPNRPNDDGDLEYSMMVVLDPDDDEHMEWLDAFEEWCEEKAEEAFGRSVDIHGRRFTYPIQLMEDVLDDPGEFEGFWCFKAKKKQSFGRPGIVYDNREPIDEQDLPDECYSGAWFIATVVPWTWDHKTGGKGISISLDNVMKIRDDEKLGGGAPSAEDDFADYKAAGRKKTRDRGRR